MANSIDDLFDCLDETPEVVDNIAEKEFIDKANIADKLIKRMYITYSIHANFDIWISEFCSIQKVEV